MIVIVVGMHRSGTSALAGMLHANGILMGENGDFYPPPMKENPKGFYENRRFRVVNDQVLRQAGYHVKTFDPKVPSWNGNVGESAWQQMHALLRYYDTQNKWWGWKDPRTCLTLWHWLRAIKDYHKGTLENVRVAVTLRDPAGVAQSMRNRGNKEKLYPGQFEALAKAYHNQALECLAAAGVPYLTLGFDQLINDAGTVARELHEYLGYPITDTSFIDPEISRTVDPPAQVAEG